MKDLLPIGTVVALKEGTKSLMIIGVMQTDDTDRVYDYIAVLYPEGFLNTEMFFLFNHEDIDDIIFKGYDNPERKAFIASLEDAYNNQANFVENT